MGALLWYIGGDRGVVWPSSRNNWKFCISRYLQIWFQKSIESIQLHIYNLPTTDLKIILTIQTFNIEPQKITNVLHNWHFLENQLLFSFGAFVEYHIEHKNPKGGEKLNRELSRNLEPKN